MILRENFSLKGDQSQVVISPLKEQGTGCGIVRCWSWEGQAVFSHSLG